MKYISYLQDGGSVVQALIQKVVQSQGQDQSALQQLVQLAEEGNEEAVAFLQELQGQSPAMKCGGRVKKKQLGEKIVKAKKASCGCQLKKVGGRLIEVDGCTGLPVHKTGDKIQYAKFGDGIKRFFTNLANAAGQSGANFTPVQVSTIPVASAPVAPQITLPASAQVTPEQARENAIARMSGKRISDRERAKWGSAYDAIISGANPTQRSQGDLARIQRMGRTLRTPISKQGGQLNYADYLN